MNADKQGDGVGKLSGFLPFKVCVVIDEYFINYEKIHFEKKITCNL